MVPVPDLDGPVREQKGSRQPEDVNCAVVDLLFYQSALVWPTYLESIHQFYVRADLFHVLEIQQRPHVKVPGKDQRIVLYAIEESGIEDDALV